MSQMYYTTSEVRKPPRLSFTQCGALHKCAHLDPFALKLQVIYSLPYGRGAAVCNMTCDYALLL